MELTPQQVQEKLEKFVHGAEKIRELKDYLLTFRFLDNHEDWLEEELARHDEAIEEIGRIYQDEMVPLVQEMATYLEQHKEDFEALVEQAELEELEPVASPEGFDDVVPAGL